MGTSGSKKKDADNKKLTERLFQLPAFASAGTTLPKEPQGSEGDDEVVVEGRWAAGDASKGIL